MKPGDFTLRLLSESDGHASLTRLLNQAYAALAERGLEFVATWQDESITRQNVERGECWVAVQEDKIVGSIVFETAEQTSECDYYDLPEVASFHQLGVLPQFQGHGVAGQLLDQVEKRAAETGAREIALDTAMPAWWLISMYERRGYRVVGMVNWKSTNYQSFILSKVLAGT